MGCGTGRIPSATPSSSHWGDLSSEVTKSGWRVGIVAAFHPSQGGAVRTWPHRRYPVGRLGRLGCLRALP